MKNGSERIVDDARSHLSLIRMLRQFHYIDMNGKDQGINVRNRSSELVKLLGDVDQIRAERKKAKNNRNKFSGFEGGMGAGGGGMSSSGRYGGFGSDSMGYGGYSGGVFGDGGGFGGQSPSDFQDTGRRTSKFDEYDEYDEADAPARSREPATRAKPPAKKPEPAPAPVADLFDFGDDDEPVTTTSTAAGKQPAGSALNMLDPTPADDDDFDDFQSATPAPQAAQPSANQFAIPPPASTASTTASTQFVAPQPISASQGANINGLVGFTSATPTPTSSGLTSPMQAPIQQSKPAGYQAATPNYFTSVSINPQPGSSHAASPSLSSMTSPTAKPAAPAAKKPSGDAFGSLWSTASASAGIQKTNTGSNKGPNLNSMAKEKASAGIWGTPSTSQNQNQQQQQQQQKPSSSAFDDLLG